MERLLAYTDRVKIVTLSALVSSKMNNSNENIALLLKDEITFFPIYTMLRKEPCALKQIQDGKLGVILLNIIVERM